MSLTFALTSVSGTLRACYAPCAVSSILILSYLPHLFLSLPLLFFSLFLPFRCPCHRFTPPLSLDPPAGGQKSFHFVPLHHLYSPTHTPTHSLSLSLFLPLSRSNSFSFPLSRFAFPQGSSLSQPGSLAPPSSIQSPFPLIENIHLPDQHFLVDYRAGLEFAL